MILVLNEKVCELENIANSKFQTLKVGGMLEPKLEGNAFYPYFLTRAFINHYLLFKDHIPSYAKK